MLLIHAAQDPHARYSHYLAELLRLEGFVDFAEAEWTAVDESLLASHDLLLLPRLTPTVAQVEQLATYVEQGGKLITFLPDAQVLRRFGLEPAWRGLVGGYLHPDPAQPPVAGLCTEPVQIIVPATAWRAPATATVLATVQPSTTPMPSAALPGIVQVQVGRGTVVLWAYDLPHAIARLRQGDPANADLSFAGLDGIYRPSELFVGQLAVEQMLLPQADLQTALLARVIETLAPRLRLWYYPEADQHSVMLMTSDDDWSTLDQFEALLAGLRQHQAHCTFYVVPQTHLTTEHMARWEAEGHTFSVHPASAADIRSGLGKQEAQRHLLAPMLEENIVRHQQEFQRSPQTIRHHAVRWLGYVEAARLLANLGIQMDVNYLSVHPFSLGYMAGSGRPLRFVDTDGTVIDCFQQPTLWTEEVLIHPEFVFSFKWTVERALAETDQMIQRAAREFYTPVTFNSHPVSFATYSSPLIEGCWDKALAEGMAIWSTDEWLAWTTAREKVHLLQDAYGFTLVAPQALPALSILLPSTLTIDENCCTITPQLLWGRLYQVATVRNLAAGAAIRFSWTSMACL